MGRHAPPEGLATFDRAPLDPATFAFTDGTPRKSLTPIGSSAAAWPSRPATTQKSDMVPPQRHDSRRALCEGSALECGLLNKEFRVGGGKNRHKKRLPRTALPHGGSWRTRVRDECVCCVCVCVCSVSIPRSRRYSYLLSTPICVCAAFVQHPSGAAIWITPCPHCGRRGWTVSGGQSGTPQTCASSLGGFSNKA